MYYSRPPQCAIVVPSVRKQYQLFEKSECEIFLSEDASFYPGLVNCASEVLDEHFSNKQNVKDMYSNALNIGTPTVSGTNSGTNAFTLGTSKLGDRL